MIWLCEVLHLFYCQWHLYHSGAISPPEQSGPRLTWKFYSMHVNKFRLPTMWGLPKRFLYVTLAGLLIFRGKKSKISRDFQGQIRGKIGRFRGIFAGKTSRNSQKNRPISREKSQNSQKNRPISLGFSSKKSNFEGFSGANSRKNQPISWEISEGNFAKKQSIKNNRLPWIFSGKFR